MKKTIRYLIGLLFSTQLFAQELTKEDIEKSSKPFEIKNLNEFYDLFLKDTKNIHRENTAKAMFLSKGVFVNGEIYNGIKIYPDAPFSSLCYFLNGTLIRIKTYIHFNNEKDRKLIADVHLKNGFHWNGTSFSEDIYGIRTISNLQKGKVFGEILTINENLELLTKGYISETKEGTFFENYSIRKIGTIATYKNNILQKKEWFDLESKTILAIGIYKNGKPFNGYFLGYKDEKNKDPLPKILFYHFEKGKEIDVLSEGEFSAKTKGKLLQKITGKTWNIKKQKNL